MDRTPTSHVLGVEAVLVARDRPVELLLRAEGQRKPRELAANASDRRTILEASVLRCASDDWLATGTRVSGQSQACRAIDEPDGFTGRVTGSSHKPASPSAQDLSISASGSTGAGAKRSVVRRYHLHPNATRLSLSGCRDGLVQPLCAVVGAIELAGGDLLCRGIGASTIAGHAGDLQHRSGSSVHQRRFYKTSSIGRSKDQHGRPREGNGQYFHRASVAQRQVRGGISARLLRRHRGQGQAEPLLPLLQHGAYASVPWQSNTLVRLFRQPRMRECGVRNFRSGRYQDMERVEKIRYRPSCELAFCGISLKRSEEGKRGPGKRGGDGIARFRSATLHSSWQCHGGGLISSQRCGRMGLERRLSCTRLLAYPREETVQRMGGSSMGVDA